MNVALEDTEEWAGGRITGRYGDCFLRGNNGEYLIRGVAYPNAKQYCISPPWRTYDDGSLMGRGLEVVQSKSGDRGAKRQREITPDDIMTYDIRN